MIFYFILREVENNEIIIDVLIVKVPREGKSEIIYKPTWWQGGLE